MTEVGSNRSRPHLIGVGGPERAGLAVAVVFTALPVLAIYSFESLAFLICLAGVLTLDRARLDALRSLLLRPGPAQALAACALWLVVAALWAPDTAESVRKALGVSALWAAGLAFVAAMSALPVAHQKLAHLFVAVSLCVVVAAYGVELATGGALAQVVKHVVYGPEVPLSEVTRVALTRIERGITVLVSLAWIGALALARVTGWRVVGLVFLAASAAVVARMPNATSIVAFATSAIVFVGAYFLPRVTGFLVTVGLVLETMMAPLLVDLVPRGGEADRVVETLKLSAVHRLEIYRYVSSLVEQRPWFGWGFDAARALSKTAPTISLPPLNHPVPLISLHPHNAPLQIWLETGYVGAALFTVFIVMLGRALLKAPWPRDVKAVAWATLMATGTIASLSFGIWQYHWLAVLWITAASVRLLAHYPVKRK